MYFPFGWWLTTPNNSSNSEGLPHLPTRLRAYAVKAAAGPSPDDENIKYRATVRETMHRAGHTNTDIQRVIPDVSDPGWRLVKVWTDRETNKMQYTPLSTRGPELRPITPNFIENNHERSALIRTLETGEPTQITTQILKEIAWVEAHIPHHQTPQRRDTWTIRTLTSPPNQLTT